MRLKRFRRLKLLGSEAQLGHIDVRQYGGYSLLVLMGVTSLAARAWRHFFFVGVPNFGPAAAAPAGPAPTALVRTPKHSPTLRFGYRWECTDAHDQQRNGASLMFIRRVLPEIELFCLNLYTKSFSFRIIRRNQDK